MLVLKTECVQEQCSKERKTWPGLACYAALGEIESPKVCYAKDWKIAIIKLQLNKGELEENSFPTKRMKSRKRSPTARDVAAKVIN